MKEVKQYMKGYDFCQRNKNCTEQPAGKLMSNSIPNKPWTYISADFITKLPLAQGYDSILVVVDWLTKMVHFIPTMEKTSVEGLARLFRDNVWKLHGLPESIILDRGPQFVAGLMRELNRMLGIESKLSMAFHPCSDLAWDDLIALLVWVDKENSIEFSFVCYTLLIHILYLPLFIKSHMSPLSHPLLCPLIS